MIDNGFKGQGDVEDGILEMRYSEACKDERFIVSSVLVTNLVANVSIVADKGNFEGKNKIIVFHCK